VRDYDATGAGAEATAALAKLGNFSYRNLLEFDRLVELLGYDRTINPLDFSVSPRGYRVLSHIPRLPDSVVHRIVDDFGSLDTVVRASQRDLEGVEGVGAVRAREIRAGLRRLQEHNLVDRYLSI
jgi:diadenylate cyclase